MIFGAALGFAGAVLFLLLFIYIKDRLLDPRELKALYGIGSLAVFPHKNVMRKNLILDKYIDSIGRDDAELISAEERAGILAAKLELFAPGTRQSRKHRGGRMHRSVAEQAASRVGVPADI